MINICKNCGTHFEASFCFNCGQKAYKKIDKKYIIDELQYTLVHTNKGFLYSLKKIIANPGKTAREFIEGNRVNHYKPIGMLFILSTVSSFIAFKVLKMGEVMGKYYNSQALSSPFMQDVGGVTQSYSSFFMLLLVPVFAACTSLILKKWGHNYYEHVIMNVYVLSASTILTIMFWSPIMYFFRDTPASFLNISYISMIGMLLMYFWFFKGFYAEKSSKEIYGNVGIIVLLLIVAYFAIIFGLMIGYMIYYAVVNGGEDLLLYVKPNSVK